jgi:hypothetical protein
VPLGLLRYWKEREGILSAPLMPLRNSSFLQRPIKGSTGLHGSLPLQFNLLDSMVYVDLQDRRAIVQKSPERAPANNLKGRALREVRCMIGLCCCDNQLLR